MPSFPRFKALHKKVGDTKELEEVEKMWSADFQVGALLNLQQL